MVGLVRHFIILRRYTVVKQCCHLIITIYGDNKSYQQQDVDGTGQLVMCGLVWVYGHVGYGWLRLLGT